MKKTTKQQTFYALVDAKGKYIKSSCQMCVYPNKTVARMNMNACLGERIVKINFKMAK